MKCFTYWNTFILPSSADCRKRISLAATAFCNFFAVHILICMSSMSALSTITLHGAKPYLCAYNMWVHILLLWMLKGFRGLRENWEKNRGLKECTWHCNKARMIWYTYTWIESTGYTRSYIHVLSLWGTWLQNPIGRSPPPFRCRVFNDLSSLELSRVCRDVCTGMKFSVLF